MAILKKTALLQIRAEPELIDAFKQHCDARFTVPSQMVRTILWSWVDARNKEALRAQEKAVELAQKVEKLGVTVPIRPVLRGDLEAMRQAADKRDRKAKKNRSHV